MAADTKALLILTTWGCETCDLFLSCMNETWWELHLSEALDWRRNAVSINQYVKFLSDTFVSGVWHIQDVTRRLPTMRRIRCKG